MSRFSEYVKAGRCGWCGKRRPVGDGGTRALCASCAEKNRTYHRSAYRLKVGIPLDAPLAPNGRPRTGATRPTASAALQTDSQSPDGSD